MKVLLQFGSIIIFLSCVGLIVNCFRVLQGNNNPKKLFALLVLVLLFKISDSFYYSFAQQHSNFLLTLGFIGFMWIGPVFYLLVRALNNLEFKFSKLNILHFLTAIIITIIWLNIGELRANWYVYHLFNRLALLQYVLYVAIAIYFIYVKFDDSLKVKKQLNLISLYLLLLGFFIILNEASGFPEIENSVIYVFISHMGILIALNKGAIFDLSSSKYKKTGLNEEEKKRIHDSLIILLDKEKVFKTNTLTQAKLAKRLETNIHSLSQVINEKLGLTYFELISSYRINEAKEKLLSPEEIKVADIAYDVGYNSLSAFNTAFKKLIGKTPTKFRDEQTNS